MPQITWTDAESENVLLQINNLKISFGFQKALKGVSFNVNKNDTHALVGESGSGKSLTCFATLGLIQSDEQNDIQVSGQIIFEGENLLEDKFGEQISNQKFIALRGRKIGYIPQNPMTSLNPVKTIYDQLSETIQIHKPALKKSEIREFCKIILQQVQLKDWEKILNSYSFELSGGMSQRIMIAMSLIGDPALLIADEPTTSLDVTIQAEIMYLLLDMIKKRNLSLLLVTHDLGLVAQSCRTMTVLEKGEVRESGEVKLILQSPQSEYTQNLLSSFSPQGSDSL